MKDNEIEKKIYNHIIFITKKNNKKLGVKSQLIGNLLDSMKLVELCVLLEDLATELNFEFDWQSEKAMSKMNSVFKSTETISKEFIKQYKNKR
tara:strand:- start:98 stop:376 length:279 start_codon:yes stop_codon:yes gene_type:complete